MADDKKPEEAVIEADVAAAPRHSQARYNAARKAVKAEAKDTVEKNAKKALADKKKAQAQANAVPGAKEFADKAKEIEAEFEKRRKAAAEQQ
jgi:hypothetical protein